MNYNEVMNVIRAKGKGQFTSVTWQKELPTRKGITNKITKTSKAVIRCGVEYDNTAAVKQGRADGTLPAENAGLKWGQWNEYPYTISHKGNDYLRCTTASNTKVQTQYFMDGNPVEKSQVEALCLKSAFSGHEGNVFNLNMENIQEIK